MILSDLNQQSLNILRRIVTKPNRNKFSLNFAHCNDSALSAVVVLHLTHDHCRILKLDPTTLSLHQTILDSIKSNPPNALIVIGLETVVDIDNLLVRVNQTRDRFLSDFPFPLILWTNDSVSKKLVRIAPDFNSWGVAINFTTENT